MLITRSSGCFPPNLWTLCKKRFAISLLKYASVCREQLCGIKSWTFIFFLCSEKTIKGNKASTEKNVLDEYCSSFRRLSNYKILRRLFLSGHFQECVILSLKNCLDKKFVFLVRVASIFLNYLLVYQNFARYVYLPTPEPPASNEIFTFLTYDIQFVNIMTNLSLVWRVKQKVKAAFKRFSL